MPLIRADRVKESSTSTSTGAFLLNGADSTYRTFASVCAVGDTVYYAIAHRSANEWEVGLGTYSAVNTLTRTTVHASSNANAAVAFSTGTKDVLLALTKAQLETYATLAGTETLTNKTISGANNTITNVSLTTGATGTLPLANGGTGTTTAQLAINALAGAVTSGSYLRGNGTNVVMAAIQAADVPTLNQNTTGTASGSVSGTASYVPKFTSANVVGNSLIYDSGTNIGVGTASPSGRIHISATGTAEAKLEGTTAAYLSFIRSGVNFGYIGLGSPGNSDIYIYNINSGAVRINNQAVYVTATNLVGVNETSPGAQLQVTSAAAATKGLIVKGAAAQSANLQEWLNNAGTVVTAVNPSGSLLLKASSVLASGYGYLDSGATAAGVITLYGGSGEMDFNVTGAFPMTFRTTGTERMRILSGGNVGIGTNAPAGQLHTQASAAATKALVVRGASAQSANLQEWQNSAGTALAYVDSGGSIYASSVYSNRFSQNRFNKISTSRSLPTTVGDYVEICNFTENGGKYTIVISCDQAGVGQVSKKYEFVCAYQTQQGVVPPSFVAWDSARTTPTNDFHLEIVRLPSAYDGRIRIKRVVGTAAITLFVDVEYSGVGSLTEYSGTGTSSLTSYTATYNYQMYAAPPPPSGNSYSGNNFSIYGGNAATTGSGGSILLYTGAGAGTGVGGLIQSRSQADSYNRSNKFILVRSIPDTVGNYVELGRIGWWNGTVLKVSVFASRGAYDATNATYNTLGKEYEFHAHYDSSGTVAPRTISGNITGGRQPNEYELELAWNANGHQVLRLRRSKADATSFSGYTACVVIEHAVWSPHAMDFAELSGTGTSALTNAYLTNNNNYCYPALIPPPTGGTSGAGTDLAIYGGSAIGTGAGGNILLQAGAYATSGSNGKVIVRGLASNTANLQEWQNNAGSQLSAVNSAGDFTNTGGQTQSERFGTGAAVSAAYTTSIGCLATVAGEASSAIGWSSKTSGVHAVAVGASSSAGEMSVAVGRGASTTTGAIAIGLSATAYNNGISIGRASSSSGIMLGYQYSGAGVGYTTLSASADGRSATGAIEIVAGDGVNYNTNYSRQHSILGTWATATYASRLGRVQLRVNDFTTDREAIRYESNGASALTSIGGAAVIASTTLAVQPAVSGNKGIVVKGASGQSANLLELQNSSGQIGLSVSVNQFGEATFVNGPRYISTAPEFSAGLWLQFLDSAIDRTNVKMHVSASIGFAAGSASVTALDTYISRGDAGVLRVNAASGAGGSIAITSNTPAAFTTDQNNLALTASGFQRLSGTAARNITGIAPPSGSHVDGRMIRLYNVGSFNLTLKHNSTSSTAANRFWNVQAIDIIVGANDYAELIYDATNNGSGAAGWRVA